MLAARSYRLNFLLKLWDFQVQNRRNAFGYTSGLFFVSTLRCFNHRFQSWRPQKNIKRPTKQGEQFIDGNVLSIPFETYITHRSDFFTTRIEIIQFDSCPEEVDELSKFGQPCPWVMRETSASFFWNFIFTFMIIIPRKWFSPASKDFTRFY